jgi:hypothetical protein
LFTDGSLNTRTAYCCDPYPGLEGTAEAYGIEETPYDELVRLMRLASSHGIEPAVHAIGDRANTLALDAFTATLSLQNAQTLFVNGTSGTDTITVTIDDIYYRAVVNGVELRLSSRVDAARRMAGQ